MAAVSDDTSFSQVLAFWFGAPGSPTLGRTRPAWFRKDAAFDEAIRQRFAATLTGASMGKFDAWQRTPYACLALLVVLDQFPRNLHRQSPLAFASDHQALAVARQAVQRGFDRLLRPVERTFMYLPFEHAEDIAAQRHSLQLFSSLSAEPGGEGLLDYARRHYDIVARFGRFPHRNQALGRRSTPEEEAFLRQPGSGF
jgi:uncharacterized protein (DUF924 family)